MGGLAATAAFCVVFCLALFKVQNFDFWWHLRTGQLIVDTGAVPSADPYCFTSEGRLWVNPSWLADVGLWLGSRAGGLALLGIGKALMIVAAFWLVYRAARRRGADEWVTLLLVAAAALGARPRLILRPFLVTGLFTAALLYVLETRRFRVFVPAGFVLWASLHAGWPAGIIVLGSAAIGELAREKSLRGTEGRSLALLALLSLIAASVNPFGWRVFAYPFRLMTVGTFMREIEEWRAPGFSAPFMAYWCILAAAGVVALLAFRRMPVRDLLLLVFLGSLSVSAQRHVLLFCIAAPLIVAPPLSRLCRAACRRREEAAFVPAVALLLVVVLGLHAVISSDRYQFGTGVRTGQFPEKAVRFLTEHPPPGEWCNEYAWGGSIAWELFPHRKAFIDGRCLVHGEKTYREWQTLSDQKTGWRDIADRYDVKTLVLMRGGPASLYTDGDWQAAYWDDLAVVWVRNCAATKAYRARHDVSLSCPDVIGWALKKADRIPLAEKQLREKLRADPDCTEAHRGLMKCAMARGRPAEAVDLLVEAVKRHPKRPDLWNDLGYCHAKVGQLPQALSCYERAAKLGPRLFIVWLNMGDTQFKLGDHVGAFRSYEKAIRLNPHYFVPYVRAGDVAAELGMPRRARKLWVKAKRLGAPAAVMGGRQP